MTLKQLIRVSKSTLIRYIHKLLIVMKPRLASKIEIVRAPTRVKREGIPKFTNVVAKLLRLTNFAVAATIRVTAKKDRPTKVTI